MDPLLLSQRIDAPQETLWRYLSTAAGLSSWQADQVSGSLDEGSFSLRWPALGARLDLSVDELEVGERIVLAAGTTRLEMIVEEGGIRVRHHGLQEGDDREGLTSSWKAALSLLRLAATTHPRKERKVSWLFHPMNAEAGLAHYYFTDSGGMSAWLGHCPQGIREGQSYRIVLSSDQVISGKVLTAQRDVCLQIDEFESAALTLRTLPAPDGRVVAAGLSTWRGEANGPLLSALEQALSRLGRLTSSGVN